MSLNKNDQLIGELGKDTPFFTTVDISCWEKQQGKLLIYVFTQSFQNGVQLIENYKLLRDHIAVCFQSQGQISDAQRWNLYIFFFVSEKVDRGIKQQVEQDKFSSRKIVIDDCGDHISDDLIVKHINADLFEIKVEKKASKETSLEKLIGENFPNIKNALNSFGARDTQEILTPLLNCLKDE